jgi:large subunit ribosomal protein L21
MYAIVETGGKQYRVKAGDTVAVEKLAGELGEILDLDRVLLIAGDGTPRIGSPGVDGAVVRAEVVGHFRGEKIIIFRYKSKVRYRRKTGHRQSLTRLRITDILVDGVSAATPAPLAVAEPVELVEDAAPAQSAATEEEPAATTEAVATTAPGGEVSPAQSAATSEEATAAEEDSVPESIETPER